MADNKQRNLSESDLEQLLRKKVIKVETKSLTAAGDNYGSVMLAVDVTLESGRNVPLVAKMFPLNEFVQKVFQCPKTMKKEIEVYQIISAEYEKIQEEQLVPPSERLHVFCNCPGARLSLENDDTDQLADENSVLLMENLKVQGYVIGDRVKGFDLKHTEFILKHLAKFHATAVAIKMKKPLVFRNKILNILTPFKINAAPKEKDEERQAKTLEQLQTIPACDRIIDTLQAIFKENLEYHHSDKARPIREPFASIAHYDFWTNNMMLKYKTEADDIPTDFKIVDFQGAQYGSPAADVVFFLFTSTQTGLVSEHVDKFLDLYYNTFVDWLDRLKCETKQFTRDKFLEEVKVSSFLLLGQIVGMLMPITFSKDQVEKFGGDVPEDEMPIEFNDVYTIKVTEAINTYIEKGWL